MKTTWIFALIFVSVFVWVRKAVASEVEADLAKVRKAIDEQLTLAQAEPTAPNLEAAKQVFRLKLGRIACESAQDKHKCLTIVLDSSSWNDSRSNFMTLCKLSKGKQEVKVCAEKISEPMSKFRSINLTVAGAKSDEVAFQSAQAVRGIIQLSRDVETGSAWASAGPAK